METGSDSGYVLIVVADFAPRERTLPEIFQGMLWQNFHEDVLNRGKSLGRTVKVLDFLLNHVDKPGLPESAYSMFLSNREPIGNLSIAGRVRDYIGMVESDVDETEMSPPERSNYVSNMAANLSRGLKYMKQNQAFLLNPEDKRHLFNFISTLSFPPAEYL